MKDLIKTRINENIKKEKELEKKYIMEKTRYNYDQIVKIQRKICGLYNDYSKAGGSFTPNESWNGFSK